MRGIGGVRGRLTVAGHRREARSHAWQARWWELVGERDLARLEWSRVTIHRRAAEINRELAEGEQQEPARDQQQAA